MAFRLGRLGRQRQRHSGQQYAAQEQADTEDAGFYENRRIVSPLAGLSFLEEFWGLLIAAILQPGPISARGAGFCNKIVLWCAGNWRQM